MERLLLLTPSTMELFSAFLPETLKEEYVAGRTMSFYGIVEDDIACGLMVLSPDGEEMELLYLYLAKSHRGKGLASRMFGELMLLLREQGVAAITAVYPSEECDSLHKILRSYGADMEETEKGTFSFTIASLKGQKLLLGTTPNMVSLEAIPDYQLRQLCYDIVEEGKDFIPMPIKKESYMAECSGVYVKDGEAQGVILLKKTGENSVAIPYLYSKALNPRAVLEMFCFIYSKAAKALSEDTVCQLHAISGSLTALLEKFLNVTSEKQVKATLSLSYFDAIENELEALLL